MKSMDMKSSQIDEAFRLSALKALGNPSVHELYSDPRYQVMTQKPSLSNLSDFPTPLSNSLSSKPGTTMAILSDNEAQQPQPRNFTASLDPSNLLKFLESAFDFVSKETEFFSKDCTEKDVVSLVRALKEKLRLKELESKRKLKEEEQAAGRKNSKIINNIDSRIGARASSPRPSDNSGAGDPDRAAFGAPELPDQNTRLRLLLHRPRLNQTAKLVVHVSESASQPIHPFCSLIAIRQVGGKSSVRIVVAGDARTRKSSLIVSESFPAKVQPLLPPSRLPVDIFPDRIPVTIIDTNVGDRRRLEEELRCADAVLLTYACDQPKTIDRLGTFWLPELRHRLEVHYRWRIKEKS